MFAIFFFLISLARGPLLLLFSRTSFQLWWFSLVCFLLYWLFLLPSFYFFGGLICCSFSSFLKCRFYFNNIALTECYWASCCVKYFILTQPKFCDKLISPGGILKLRDVKTLAQSHTAHQCNSNSGPCGFRVLTSFLQSASTLVSLCWGYFGSLSLHRNILGSCRSRKSQTLHSPECSAAWVLHRNGSCQSLLLMKIWKVEIGWQSPSCPLWLLLTQARSWDAGLGFSRAPVPILQTSRWQEALLVEEEVFESYPVAMIVCSWIQHERWPQWWQVPWWVRSAVVRCHSCRSSLLPAPPALPTIL